MRAKHRTTIHAGRKLRATDRLDRSAATGRHRQPNKTRRALIEAAARIFNSAGYHGTDSNRIAREAGYAPGTFYVHFADKLAIFLEVYESWVSAEWSSIEAILKSGGSCARNSQPAQPRRARAPSQVADVSREPARAERHR